MATTKKRSGASKNDGATVGYEAGLWRVADTLRGQPMRGRSFPVGFVAGMPSRALPDEVQRTPEIFTSLTGFPPAPIRTPRAARGR